MEFSSWFFVCFSSTSTGDDLRWQLKLAFSLIHSLCTRCSSHESSHISISSATSSTLDVHHWKMEKILNCHFASSFALLMHAYIFYEWMNGRMSDCLKLILTLWLDVSCAHVPLCDSKRQTTSERSFKRHHRLTCGFTSSYIWMKNNIKLILQGIIKARTALDLVPTKSHRRRRWQRELNSKPTIATLLSEVVKFFFLLNISETWETMASHAKLYKLSYRKATAKHKTKRELRT